MTRGDSCEKSAGDSKDVTGLVELLHKAATGRSIPPKQVCAAMVQIEKQKLPVNLRQFASKLHWWASLTAGPVLQD